MLLILSGLALAAVKPTPRSEPSSPADLQKVTVDAVEDGVIMLELSGEGAATEDHPAVVAEAEVPGVLLGRVVPRDVVKVMVDQLQGGVGTAAMVVVVFGVANEGLEVKLWGGDDIGEVEEECPGQIVPPHYAVLCKRP